MSSPLLQLREEILSTPYIEETKIHGAGGSVFAVAELGLFDLGVLTQAAAILVDRESNADPKHDPTRQAQRLGAIVLPVASHIGSLKDSESNKLMADIGGPLFGECFQLLRSLHGRNSYDETYLRLATERDADRAVIIDQKIAAHAAEFITSTEGSYLLEPAEAEDPTMGCPLRRVQYPDSEVSYFDLLAMRTVEEFVDPRSRFFGLGYYGIAQSIVAGLQPSKFASFRLSNPGGERNWQLPDPDMQTQASL